MKSSIFILSLIIFFICVQIAQCDHQEDVHVTFLSGNNQNKNQSYWNVVIASIIAKELNVSADNARTDLLLWLGNVIDTDARRQSYPEGKIKKVFEEFRNDPEYESFIQRVVQRSGGVVDGSWDSQDFGRRTPDDRLVQEMKHIFLNFLGEPIKSKVLSRTGFYHFNAIPVRTTSILSKHFINSVCVITLDVMSARDSNPHLSDVVLRWKTQEPPQYLRIGKKPGAFNLYDERDLLGEQQWRWLEETIELYVSSGSRAPDGRDHCAVTVLASPWQILLNDNKPFNGWDWFPAARSRLLDLLQRKKAQRFLFFSGHGGAGEVGILKKSSPENVMPNGVLALYAQKLPVIPPTKKSSLLLPSSGPLIEVTSSGLTNANAQSGFMGWLHTYSIRPAIEEAEPPRNFYPRFVSLNRTVVSKPNFGTMTLSREYDSASSNESLAYCLSVFRIKVSLYSIDVNNAFGKAEILIDESIGSLPSYNSPSSSPENEVPQFVVYNIPSEYPSLKHVLMTNNCPEYDCALKYLLWGSSFLPLVAAGLVFLVLFILLVWFLGQRLIFPLRQKTRKIKTD